MKYQLIKPINQQYSALQQVLTNRGIQYKNIKNYLTANDSCISPPQMLGQNNLRDAATALISTIQQNKKTIVIVDCDCDGYTSSAVLINYLYDLFPSYVLSNLIYYVHDSKQHGLNDCYSWILEKENIGLVVCPDSSSNDYKQHKILKQNNIKIIVLDHHDAEKISEDAIIINNQLSSYPNKFLSGAGVTWQFCRYIDKLLNTTNANKYLDLVALGLDADMMSLLSIQTKYLIQKGFKKLNNPFIVYMADKNSFSLKGKLNPIGVAFYIAPFVNSMTRSGTIEEKILLFESMLTFKAYENIPSTKRGHKAGDTEKIVQQAIRVATNVKNRQAKAQDDGMQIIQKKIEKQNLLSHKVLLFLLEPGQIDRNIAGLVANKIMAKYQRPTCILTKTINSNNQEDLPWGPIIQKKISYDGSARGCDKSGITDFKAICLQTGVCNFAQGHPGAFGLSINEQNIDQFIRKTDIALQDMSSETMYYVDYIYTQSSINTSQILEIAEMDDFWGKDIDQPYIALQHIKIIPSMITVYQKTSNTLKITLQNGLSLIKFKASDEECEKLQGNYGYYEMNIIGRCNKNEWNGYITPQLFIEQYEIIDSNKYYF